MDQLEVSLRHDSFSSILYPLRTHLTANGVFSSCCAFSFLLVYSMFAFSPNSLSDTRHAKQPLVRIEHHSFQAVLEARNDLS